MNQLEQAVLACLILTGDKDPDEVDPKWLTSEEARKIHAAISRLRKEGSAVDFVTISDESGVDPLTVSSLVDSLPSLDSYDDYRDALKRAALRRSIKEFSVRLSLQAESGDPSEILSSACQYLSSLAPGKTDNEIKLSEYLFDYIEALEDDTGEKPIPTGIVSLDNLLSGGLHAGRLYVIAGRPGRGKSALALNWIRAAGMAGYPSLILSLEMGRSELSLRLLSQASDLPIAAIEGRRLTAQEWSRLIDKGREIAAWGVRIDDGTQGEWREVAAAARKSVGESRTSVVLIDYLQLLANVKATGGRALELGAITRDVKLLAKNLGVSVILLSQLNRESERHSRRPNLSDLRDSGSIESDADVVLFVHWPDPSPAGILDKEVELIVEKNRQGPTGMVRALFKPQTTVFVG